DAARHGCHEGLERNRAGGDRASAAGPVRPDRQRPWSDIGGRDIAQSGRAGPRVSGGRGLSLEEKLHRVVQRHEELGAAMSGPGAIDSQTFAQISKEYAELTPI